MSMTTLSLEDRRSGTWTARAADYLELTKPRIAVMVLVTVAVAARVGSSTLVAVTVWVPGALPAM